MYAHEGAIVWAPNLTGKLLPRRRRVVGLSTPLVLGEAKVILDRDLFPALRDDDPGSIQTFNRAQFISCHIEPLKTRRTETGVEQETSFILLSIADAAWFGRAVL